MSYPVYYPISGDTLPHLFGSYDGGDGSSITMTGLAVTDIEIYKDGGTTQRSSDAGYTLLDTDGIDFDSLTGIHGFSIDLSDNTDAGFYAVGPWYHVVVSAITIDAQTVSFVACAFRILDATRGMAGTALPDAAADAAGGLPISDAGGLDIDAKLANTNEITAARMGALTDWINGGRLDLILDIIAADTTTDIPALLATIDGIVDAILIDTAGLNGDVMRGTDSAATAAALATVDAIVDAILIDTAGLNGDAMRGTDSAATAANLATVDTVVDAIKAVTDLLPDAGALSAIGTDTARLTAVRAAVLTDWINGGRLDLLLDAIPTTAMRGTDSAATAANLATVDTVVDAIKAVTDLLPDAGALNDLATILADTNMLQVDWVNGGRLDLILDIIAADTTTDIPALIAALNDPTVAAIADAVFDEAKAGHVAAGSFGEEIQTHGLSSEIAALNDLSAADVNAEVDTALTTTTYGEPGQGTPSATLSIEAKLSYLFKNWRNRKAQDAAVWELYNDDAATVDQKAAVSDDGTDSEKGEIATGP